MNCNVWQAISWPVLFVGVAAPLLANCGGSMPGGGSLPGVPGAGNCPDMTRIESIDQFDFEKEFKLNAEAAGKIKAGAGASAEMKEVASKIDADLRTSCGNLAHDLGASGDYKDGQEACKAASRAIADAKAKMGASVRVMLDFTEPRCSVNVNAYADCAGHCDASVTPGKADIKCEGGKLQGECSGKCQGDCEIKGSAVCSGECNGSCDAEIRGACSGKCNGKCDGKAMPAGANGKCDGTCEGKCDGNVKAECKGKCGGECQIKGQAECSGTCTGSCSVEMEAPRCAGKVEPPKMSAECKAKCDAKVQAKAECTPAHVAVRIAAAADVKAEEMFRSAIEKNLPGVLKVSLGMGRSAEHLAGEMKVVVEGAQATVQTAGDPMVTARLTACVAAPFKEALDAAASVRANVSVSVNVQASASGSAKAGG